MHVTKQTDAVNNISTNIWTGWFHIDPETGILETAQALDYETSTFHTFLVMGVDSYNESGTAQGTKRTGTATITVNVADVNDNAPVFSQEIYRAHAAEASKASNIIQVETPQINRPNLQSNGMSTHYQFMKGNSFGNFAIFWTLWSFFSV